MRHGRVGGAQHGVPGEGRRAGFQGATHVEEHDGPGDGRQGGDEGRPADLRPAAEPEGGGGDRGAGGTGGDEGVGGAVPHRGDGGADGALRACRAGVVGHADLVPDRAHRDPGPVHRFQGGDQRVGDLGRSDEQQVQVRIGADGPQSAVNHDGGSVVPAEEVNGDPRGARLHRRADR